MNIENEGPCRLAGEMASERRERESDARLRKMRVIARRCSRLLREGGPPVDHGDLLYDDRGLPK